MSIFSDLTTAVQKKPKGPHIIGLQLLLSASDVLPLQLVVDLGEVLDVLQPQLLVDDVQVSDGVDLPLDVGDLLVLEGS